MLRHTNSDEPSPTKLGVLSRGRILGRNPDKSLKSFPPCYSDTPTALPWDFYFFKLTQHLTHFFKLMQPLTYFFKLMQPLTYFFQTHATSKVFLQTHTISKVFLLFSYCTLKRERRKTIPPSLWVKKSIQKPQVWERNCAFMNSASADGSQALYLRSVLLSLWDQLPKLWLRKK